MKHVLLLAPLAIFGCASSDPEQSATHSGISDINPSGVTEISANRLLAAYDFETYTSMAYCETLAV